MIFVMDAIYINDYKIQLRFSDDREGIVDLQEVIHNDHCKIFQELKDIKLFKNFHVEMDTVVWINGLDLSPEFLWERTIN